MKQEGVRRPLRSGALAEAFRERDVKIFMLANQLPLLQSGLEPAGVRTRCRRYCQPDGGALTRTACSRRPS